ncbi:MAG: hypothetical protein ACFFD2_03035 [Promethearchaeota archaeon]
MVQIKFAPMSTEKEIPRTDYTVQIGVIQNKTRTWGVKISQAGRNIVAKQIKKLIDVEIINIIRDTIGKKVSLDTFELGTIMSMLLREVYEKIKRKQKQTEPQKAVPQPAPTGVQQSVISQSNAQQTVKNQPKFKPPPQLNSSVSNLKIPSIPPMTSGNSDDFWASYSDIETSESYAEAQPTPQLKPQPTPQLTPQKPAQATTQASSNGLDEAFAILGINCPNCGVKVDPDQQYCLICGQKL